MKSDRFAACDLWVAMSGRYEEELGDTDRAIEALKTALTIDRDNRDAEAALDALLRRVGAWRDLLERLRTQLAQERSPEESLELCHVVTVDPHRDSRGEPPGVTDRTVGTAELATREPEPRSFHRARDVGVLVAVALDQRPALIPAHTAAPVAADRDRVGGVSGR